MTAVEHVTFCQRCDEKIYPEEVYKVTEINGSPKHCALAYECMICNYRGKAVAVKDDWNAIQSATIRRNADHERNFRLAEIEVAAVDDVEDLRRLWSTLPPPVREEIMFKCQCRDCRRRLYGEG